MRPRVFLKHRQKRKKVGTVAFAERRHGVVEERWGRVQMWSGHMLSVCHLDNRVEVRWGQLRQRG